MIRLHRKQGIPELKGITWLRRAQVKEMMVQQEETGGLLEAEPWPAKRLCLTPSRAHHVTLAEKSRQLSHRCLEGAF